MSNEDVQFSEIFDDEKTLGAIYMLHIIVGICAFLIIFLLGWLIFDYFWSSMIIGAIAMLYAFKRMINISMAKIEHDKFVQESREEAEEMGFNPDKAEKNAKIALDAITKAVRN